MPDRDTAGPANVGEFSPMRTPERPGEIVSTAKDTAQNHSRAPVNTTRSGSMTRTYNNVTNVEKR